MKHVFLNENLVKHIIIISAIIFPLQYFYIQIFFIFGHQFPKLSGNTSKPLDFFLIIYFFKKKQTIIFFFSISKKNRHLFWHCI